jgi:hypothetical protein
MAAWPKNPATCSLMVLLLGLFQIKKKNAGLINVGGPNLAPLEINL